MKKFILFIRQTGCTFCEPAKTKIENVMIKNGIKVDYSVEYVESSELLGKYSIQSVPTLVKDEDNMIQILSGENILKVKKIEEFLK